MCSSDLGSELLWPMLLYFALRVLARPDPLLLAILVVLVGVGASATRHYGVVDALHLRPDAPVVHMLAGDFNPGDLVLNVVAAIAALVLDRRVLLRA